MRESDKVDRESTAVGNVYKDCPGDTVCGGVGCRISTTLRRCDNSARSVLISDSFASSYFNDSQAIVSVR